MLSASWHIEPETWALISCCHFFLIILLAPKLCSRFQRGGGTNKGTRCHNGKEEKRVGNREKSLVGLHRIDRVWSISDVRIPEHGLLGGVKNPGRGIQKCFPGLCYRPSLGIVEDLQGRSGQQIDTCHPQ